MANFSERQRMRMILDFYKWHIIFVLLVVICIGFIIVNVTSSTDPDLTIGYIGTHYVNEQNFNDNKALVEHLLKDATEDGETQAIFIPHTMDLQYDIDKTFESMIESKSYQIFIATKETFENYKDKSAFSTLIEKHESNPVLKDSSGRIYAVSLDGNVMAELYGIKEEGYYIAAANYDDEKLIEFEKNGINIANDIVENRK